MPYGENHLTPEERADLDDPNVGTGTPDTAPWEAPPTTLLERQPVRVLGAAQAIAAAAVVIIALGVPVWAGLALAVALYAVEEAKRQRVTPVADPKLDADIPLTPDDPR
jgi:hypothetical protein